jgi:outer membrane protein
VQAFVEVGTRPEIDLAQARTDRANAQVQLINAQNGYETAKAQLNLAMGVEGPTDYDISDDTLPAVAGEDGDPAALLQEALASRPELSAAQQNVSAEELSLRAARVDYAPALSLSSSFSDAGSDLGSLAWNWNAALGLSVPIFKGGQTQAQVRDAKWALESARAQADALRQQVRLEVEQARLAVRAARAALDAAGEALVNAQEQLRLAEGRYEAGVGNIIELGDAQVAHTSAAQQKVQAEYHLASARADLLRALGRL